MKYPIYNQNGEEVNQVLLPKEIFDVTMNSDLLHQVVVSQMANRRQVLAHTKDRGEVRGGGKKPWRQKGTGRARHGSIRSPIFRGGGVTFGPTNRKVFKKTINRNMRRRALLISLSAKRADNSLILLDNISLKNSKTKLMKEMLDKLPCKNQSCLISLPAINKDIILASRNLAKIDTIEARNLNALDLLSFKYLILSKESMKTIEEVFSK